MRACVYCRSRGVGDLRSIYFVFLLHSHFFFPVRCIQFVGSEKIMMIFQNLVQGAVITAFFASSVGAVDNGLAITPQMGCESCSSTRRKCG